MDGGSWPPQQMLRGWPQPPPSNGGGAASPGAFVIVTISIFLSRKNK